MLSLSYDAMPAEYASVIITEFGATAARCFLCMHYVQRFVDAGSIMAGLRHLRCEVLNATVQHPCLIFCRCNPANKCASHLAGVSNRAHYVRMRTMLTIQPATGTRSRRECLYGARLDDLI